MTTTIISVTAIILGTAGFIISLVCVAMVAGFTRSTHTVQYVEAPKAVDIPDPFLEDKIEEEAEKELFAKVGKKKPAADPVTTMIDDTMDEVTKTDTLF